MIDSSMTPYEKAFTIMDASRRDSERYKIYRKAVDDMQEEGLSIFDMEEILMKAERDWVSVVKNPTQSHGPDGVEGG